MNKRTQIMLFTAFSLVIGPLIILGFLFWIRMAVRDWNKLKDKIKLAWKN